MPISVKDVADMFGKDVFTGRGFYCGKISDLEFDLGRFKIRSLVIEASRGSFLSKVVSGKKGIVVPYPLVQAIGDIVIIKHIATPMPSEEEMAQESVAEIA
jgi:sporulation protein YlmC with PRC-barrel domain